MSSRSRIDILKSQYLKNIIKDNLPIFNELDGVTYLLFLQWLPYNLHVYDAFVEYARQLVNTQNRNRYSAGAVWQRLRWDTMIQQTPGGTKDAEYNRDVDDPTDERRKLNDRYVAFLSRLVMLENPELYGVFLTRAKKTKGKAFSFWKTLGTDEQYHPKPFIAMNPEK